MAVERKTSKAQRVRWLQTMLITAAVAACSSEKVQTRPAGRPVPGVRVTDCGNIFDRYRDPSASVAGSNIAPGEFDVKRDEFESASYVFGLRVEDSRFYNANPGLLTFTLRKNEADAVIVELQIDVQTIAVNTIAKTLWACTPQGLKMTVQARDGAPLDKVPGNARTRRELTMYRVANALYVRSTVSAIVRIHDVLPWRSQETYWTHYQSVP